MEKRRFLPKNLTNQINLIRLNSQKESQTLLVRCRKMAEGDKKTSSSLLEAAGVGRCKVESLITVDERGQMVLPKDIREKANIQPGDKLALVSWEKDGEVCCVSLIKADELVEMVKGLLGPMMKDILSG
jgi:antitoxin PrlF